MVKAFCIKISLVSKKAEVHIAMTKSYRISYLLPRALIVLHDFTMTALLWVGLAWLYAHGDNEPIIGIIAMYSAQRDLIRRKLEQAEWAAGLRERFTVGTVDSYQGKENRIIVLSVVRNDTDEHIGFLSDPERINVAISRAKDRLVIVSSSAMWRSRSMTPMKRVLDEVESLAAREVALFVQSKDLKRSLAHA